LPRRSGDAHLYRLGHPLADAVIERAKARELPPVEVHLDYGEHEGKVSILEPLRGTGGSLSVAVLSVESLDQQEDHLLFAAIADSGARLDDEVARRLLSMPGRVVAPMTAEPPEAIGLALQERKAQIQDAISRRNARFFEAETEKLEGWADDLKAGLEREIKQLDRMIKEARRAANAAALLEEKLAGQKQIKALESQRNEKRRSLFDAQDEVDANREKLIASIEAKLTQKTVQTQLFSVRWSLA
jgi:adenine-specific DNA-methyltransferase